MIIYPGEATDACITVVYKTMWRGRYVVAWSTYTRYTDHSVGANKYVLILFREGVHYRSLHFATAKERDEKFDYLLGHRISTCMPGTVWP